MYANTNVNINCTDDTIQESCKNIFSTMESLRELKELMYNPTYDLEAQIGILHDENNATIFYVDGTQFQRERR